MTFLYNKTTVGPFTSTSTEQHSKPQREISVGPRACVHIIAESRPRFPSHFKNTELPERCAISANPSHDTDMERRRYRAHTKACSFTQTCPSNWSHLCQLLGTVSPEGVGHEHPGTHLRSCDHSDGKSLCLVFACQTHAYTVARRHTMGQHLIVCQLSVL